MFYVYLFTLYQMCYLMNINNGEYQAPSGKAWPKKLHFISQCGTNIGESIMETQSSLYNLPNCEVYRNITGQIKGLLSLPIPSGSFRVLPTFTYPLKCARFSWTTIILQCYFRFLSCSDLLDIDHKPLYFMYLRNAGKIDNT